MSRAHTPCLHYAPGRALPISVVQGEIMFRLEVWRERLLAPELTCPFRSIRKGFAPPLLFFRICVSPKDLPCACPRDRVAVQTRHTCPRTFPLRHYRCAFALLSNRRRQQRQRSPCCSRSSTSPCYGPGATTRRREGCVLSRECRINAVQLLRCTHPIGSSSLGLWEP